MLSFITVKLKNLIACIVCFVIIVTIILCVVTYINKNNVNKYYETPKPAPTPTASFLPTPSPTPKKYIKWVDFQVPYRVLERTLNIDINSRDKDMQLDWVDLLAYLSAKYGGQFSRYRDSDLTSVVEKLESGVSWEEITKDMKYFPYYKEAYEATLGEFVGYYSVEQNDENNPNQKIWVEKYGLKVFSPIARGYSYSHCDDFGNSRSYGYKRKHLGHDLMGRIGTPVIAMESGIVECLGWNQYGGWRVGIRSFDKKRYYYYAHLKKDHPYNDKIKQGSVVKAGDVIGYLGMTGYSSKENVNNIQTPHLHVGLQLIFDESQKDGVNQIWIDLYNIVKLLEKNKSPVYRNDVDGKTEYYRVFDFKEPLLDKANKLTQNP